MYSKVGNNSNVGVPNVNKVFKKEEKTSFFKKVCADSQYDNRRTEDALLNINIHFLFPGGNYFIYNTKYRDLIFLITSK